MGPFGILSLQVVILSIVSAVSATPNCCLVSMAALLLAFSYGLVIDGITALLYQITLVDLCGSGQASI